MTRARLLVLIAMAALLPTAAGRDEEQLCPYCEHDPALMAAAGIVSHGGFGFGTGTTEDVDRMLSTSDIVWIESAHFEIGIALAHHKVKGDERDKVRGELARLAEVLPAVKVKSKALDPWLRAHLYAQRAEDLWSRFLEIVQVPEEAFPDGEKTWDTRDAFMGEGPYLGQKGKFELLLLASERASLQYLTESYGLPIRKTQRWHRIETGTLSVTVHTEQAGLRDDRALHGHVAFNLGVLMLQGFKHYTYDLPVWLVEGLAHHLEREIDPRFNSFDGAEGSSGEITNKANWEAEVRRLVKADEAPRMAELMGLTDFSSLDLRHHYGSWSMVDWLLRTNPGGFACYLGALSAQLNEAGIPDGSNMSEAHRRVVRECLRMGYAELDLAWKTWVGATYGSR